MRHSALNEPGRSALGADLPHRITATSPAVLVVGDGVLDVWLTGVSHRLCREAPVPVVDVTARSCAPGGAANTAVNLAALGAAVTLISVLGDDHEAEVLRRLLPAAGVSTSGLVVDPGRHTPVKQRLIAAEALLARYDINPGRPPGPSAARATVRALHAALRDTPSAAVVVVDHGLGSLTPQLVAELRKRRHELSFLLVDAHDVALWAALKPDLVTPNVAEAARLLNMPVPVGNRLATVGERGEELRAAAGARTVVLTADREGALLITGPSDAAGQPCRPRRTFQTYRTYSQPAPELQAAGAGDSFVAALTLGVVAGLELPEATELAQAAADVAVRRPGTSVCSESALADRLRRYRTAALDERELAIVVGEHRAEGRRIVFTNGCFDVLHRGHVAYLNQAKQLGDVLIVAVNDDAGVRRLKGPSRPINPLPDRVAVLAALSCVDHVAVFAQDTPARLIELVRPEHYAKGGDYTPEMLPETPLVRRLGGQVHVLDYLPDRSTSQIVNRIRAGSAGAAGG